MIRILTAFFTRVNANGKAKANGVTMKFGSGHFPVIFVK